jgi:hypothetical protein
VKIFGDLVDDFTMRNSAGFSWEGSFGASDFSFYAFYDRAADLVISGSSILN